MNGAQLHLVLNHVPVLGALGAALLLLWALLAGSRDLARAGFAGLLVVALFSAGAYFSGEEAEEVVEDYPAVQEQVIEAHEEAAELAFILGLFAAVPGLAGLWLERSHLAPRRVHLFLGLGFALLVFGDMAYTAHLGGLIRHPELENALSAPDRAGADSRAIEHDDD
ncbi:MAG: hypothetical protein H7A21_13930 [Spirochaetales bacterium]|nr:hypothetical protein [Leptospiraceae bacterium]MCP5482531.1 hypothetical protein [Spirochaetales bacterium]MCP5485121.1 hypothetical protein [Spirochaetales bacterium]